VTPTLPLRFQTLHSRDRTFSPRLPHGFHGYNTLKHCVRLQEEIFALHQENTALKEDLGKANKRAKQDHKTIEEVLQKHYKQSCIIAKLNRELNESTAGKLCLLAKAVAAQASEMTKMRTEMHKILAYVKCKP